MFQLKELKERQKQQLRHKALKKGLDPEALTGKYPVRILPPILLIFLIQSIPAQNSSRL